MCKTKQQLSGLKNKVSKAKNRSSSSGHLKASSDSEPIPKDMLKTYKFIRHKVWVYGPIDWQVDADMGKCSLQGLTSIIESPNAAFGKTWRIIWLIVKSTNPVTFNTAIVLT